MLLLAALTCLPTPAQASPAAPRPDNVLVIVADDVGVERIDLYGLDVVEYAPTPTLDRLARAGVVFTNAWSDSVCSPSRAEMLTGRFGFRTGIGIGVPYNNPGASQGNFQIGADETTLPEVLRSGHRTLAVGKWHLAMPPSAGGDGVMHPILFGFDVHRGPMANLGGPQSDPGVYFDFEKQITTSAGSQTVAVHRYATTDQVDDALDLIRATGPTPWFLWLAFNAPHSPYHVPPAELISVDVEPGSSAGTKQIAAIEAMDTEIGRLLDGIAPAVLARTWVLFVADNGSHSQALLPYVAQAKGTVMEFGIHVPLIVTGPQLTAPGRFSDRLVPLTDLFASVCELAGATPPPDAGQDSVSFVPLLKDPTAPTARRYGFSEKFSPNGVAAPVLSEKRRALRDQRYKLIRQAAVPTIAFYDLWADPLGLDNLYPDLTPEQAKAFALLDAQLDKLLD